MITRRELLGSFGVAFLATRSGSYAAGGTKVWRVGVLASVRRPYNVQQDEHYGQIVLGLRELGYVEGKNLVIEWRFADGRYERFPELANELVGLGVAVIVTDGTPPTLAALKATKIVPIVFASAGDPVGNGLVKTLTHPGGNATGISLITTDTAAKQLEILLSLAISPARIGLLLNPANPLSAVSLRAFQAAASTRNIPLVPAEIRSEGDIENALSAMTTRGASAFILTRDRVFYQERRLFADLALHHRLPSMGSDRYYPAAGGLMSYGQNLAENFRRATVYVDKILKGANPADLPVEQPTTLELVINRKTAKALGLTIPPELLVLADKVVE